MKEDEIRSKLENLYTELKNKKSDDPETQERLRVLTTDIKETLDHINDRRPESDKGILDHMKSAVQHFETSHPELTSVLNDVISSLAHWGI